MRPIGWLSITALLVACSSNSVQPEEIGHSDYDKRLEQACHSVVDAMPLDDSAPLLSADEMRRGCGCYSFVVYHSEQPYSSAEGRDATEQLLTNLNGAAHSNFSSYKAWLDTVPQTLESGYAVASGLEKGIHACLQDVPDPS